MVRISDGDKRADGGCRRAVAASPVARQFSLGTKTRGIYQAAGGMTSVAL